MILLTGLLGLLGNHRESDALFSVGPSPRMAVSTAGAILLLGVGMLLSWRRLFPATIQKGGPRPWLSPYLYIVASSAIALLHLGLLLAAGHFDFLTLMVMDVGRDMPFLSAACLLIANLGLFFMLRKPGAGNLGSFGAGLCGLLLINIILYVWTGYLNGIPVLYNNRLAIPSSLVYFMAGLSLLLGTIPYRGLLFPLTSPNLGVRLSVCATLLLGMTIMLDGINDIVRLQKALHLFHLPLQSQGLDNVYVLSSISSIVLSLVVTLIGLQAIRYYMDQREAQNALQELTRNLEMRIGQRTEELVNTNLALESAMKKLQDREEQRHMFISTLTHDLRTPLIAQKRVLELLNEEFRDRTETESALLAEGLLQNNNKLLDMVGKILETYQYEDGKITLNLDTVRLHELAESCIAEMSGLSQAKRLSVENRISPDLPTIKADVSQLKRVFQNLLGNAIEQLQDGGHITLDADEREDSLEIRVMDDGPGIDPDIKPFLFERYFMGSKKQKIGSGLGLFICRLIIQLHGGQIFVRSEPGQGTTFIFSLSKKPAKVTQYV